MAFADVQMPEFLEGVHRDVWLSAVEFLCGRLGRPVLFGVEAHWSKSELDLAKSLDPSLNAGIVHPAIIFGTLFGDLRTRLSAADPEDLGKLSNLSLADQVRLCAGSKNFYTGLAALGVSAQFIEILKYILPDKVEGTQMITVSQVEEALDKFLKGISGQGELVDTRGKDATNLGSGRPAAQAVPSDEDMGHADTMIAPLDLDDTLRKGKKD